MYEWGGGAGTEGRIHPSTPCARRSLHIHASLASLASPPPQGTKVERVINELFEGHTHMIIQCLNVDSKSSRKESFMDLQV